MNVTLILPTYNESGNIQRLIERLEEIFKKIKNHKLSILVVDDNSPDGTGEIVKKLCKKYKNLYLLSGERKGLGAAYIRGIDYALKNLNTDAFFEMDADFSHDPNDVSRFLKKLEKGTDFVVGSRYIKGGSIPKEWGLERKIFSILGNLTVRFGLGILSIHDWTSGYRAIKKDVYLKSRNKLLGHSGYTFQIVFLYNAFKENFKIAEVPISFEDRKYGKSKLARIDYISNALLYVLKTRVFEFLGSAFFKYCVVGTIGFSINAAGLEGFYRLGFSPGVAAGLGAELAIISNFILNNFWTFSHKRINSPKKYISKFFQFNLTSLGAIFIIGVGVGLGTYFFGEKTRFIFFVASVVFLVIPYNYLIYDRVIWKKPQR